MIEDHWVDFVCYSIHFVNEHGLSFYRSIALPINFPEEKVTHFFRNHFEKNDIKIIEINEISDIWLSKHSYSSYLENN